MADYNLSERAETDYFSIFYFGAVRFGRDQAVTYILELDNAFLEIAKSPMRYEVVTIGNGTYRRAVHKSHSIYFEIREEYVLILRILGRQDLAKAFL